MGHRAALVDLLESDAPAVDLEVTRRVVQAVHKLGRGIAERVAERVLRLDERRRLVRVRKQRAHVQPRQPGAQDPRGRRKASREAGDEAMPITFAAVSDSGKTTIVRAKKKSVVPPAINTGPSSRRAAGLERRQRRTSSTTVSAITTKPSRRR